MKQLNKQLFLFVDIRRIWIGIFLFTTASALMFQLVILPYFAPGLHAGNGLVAGGDYVGFHRLAATLAEKIAQQGWGAWELRTKQQAPAGIAAAVYVFTGPHPWALIPLNAAVHATAAALIVRLVQPFVPNIRYAALCVLPFVLFPSSLTWYAQIHKDGLFFLGLCLCLYAWVLLSRAETWSARCTQAFLSIAYVFLGCFFIWVMRPYGIKLVQGIGLIFALVLVPSFVFRAWRGQLQPLKALLAILVILALPFAVGVFKDGAANGEVTIATNEMFEPLSAEEEQRGGLVASRGSFASKAQNVVAAVQWKKTQWLPDALDNVFLTLSIVRYGYAGSIGGSNVDTDVVFDNALSFFPYLPRAIQLGFMAPFPASWFEQGTVNSSGVLRKVSVAEMLLVYGALLFLPYILWRGRKKMEIWLIFCFCIIFILLYTYITPNIGSLYRSRHGFLLLLAAFGIAGVISFRRRSQGIISPSMWQPNNYS